MPGQHPVRWCRRYATLRPRESTAHGGKVQAGREGLLPRRPAACYASPGGILRRPAGNAPAAPARPAPGGAVMESWMPLAGLGLGLGGALVAGLSDAWLSRSVLIYLDAVEANVAQLVAAVREGHTTLQVTVADLRRDRGQDRARALKLLGWVLLAAGLGLQVTAACVARRPG